jgi:predicted dehydrogenase
MRVRGLQPVSHMKNAKQKPIRMAVVGLGHFAQAAVLPALRQLQEVEIAALVSGTPEKLETLATRYHVPIRSTYDRYDELMASGDIDAVYIAVPNDQHAEYAIRAGRRGVHVLVEKPMATTEDEAVAMIEACEQGRAKLMVAYRLHFEAANLNAIEMIQSGRIGDARLMSSVFSMQVRPGNIRIQRRPGAGPIYDLGVYCINAARYLFQSEPVSVMAVEIDNPADDRFRHVPQATSVVLRFKGGEVAQFTCSFGASSRAYYQVIGSEGRIELDNAFEYTEPMKMLIVKGDHRQTKTFRKKDQIAAEIAYFARCVRDDITPEPSGYEGLTDVRIIQGILRSAQARTAVELHLPERMQRPSGDQIISMPAHGEPRLVEVESASHS